MVHILTEIVAFHRLAGLRLGLGNVGRATEPSPLVSPASTPMGMMKLGRSRH